MAEFFPSCYKKNITLQVLHAQNTGKKIKYRNVPSELLVGNRHNDKFNTKIDQGALWHNIQTLDQLYYSSIFNTFTETLIENLKAIHQMFGDDDRNLRLSTFDNKSSSAVTISDLIYIFGGVEVMLRILFHPSIGGKKDGKCITAEAQQKIQLYCLEILHGVCLVVEDAALAIGKHDGLIEYLFVCMEDKKTFLSASTLLEELLAVNRKIVDLKQIKNLHTLAMNIQESSFPGFCRILSTTVADIDFSDQKGTLLAQDKKEKDRSIEKSLADQNQGLLLSFPEFLSRMVKLASKPFPGGTLSNQIPAAFQSLVLNPTTILDNLQDVFNMSGQHSIPNAGYNQNESSSSAMTLPSDLPAWLPLPVQVIHEVMHKVEILYVLTLLLCGKYKFEVQTKLCELKCIPMLCDMFDKLGWNTENDRFPRHNHHDAEDCDCTPESALKIQYLRFIHSFCDHNDKRYLLLSVREVQEMKETCERYGLQRPATLDKSKSKYRCHGPKGLITKIIDVLKKTSPNNALRFWLCRAIEGFLRGSVSPPGQHFLINRGLIKHLFEHIINCDTKAKEIIQSSFDLLGELMKFNVAGFQQFNQAVESDGQFEKFLSVMSSSVVDSNMFIRCAVLSHEQFSATRVYNVQQCSLCGLIRKWEHKIYLMYKLITTISVDSLTQENVSCLNTTLIILMFAYNHGRLDEYLQAFVTEEDAQKHPGLILSNLRELLVFWKSHYLRRGKDCSQLEQSSSIAFDKWQHVVDVMLSEDITKRTSVLYYLTPLHRSSIRYRTVDYMSRDA